MRLLETLLLLSSFIVCAIADIKPLRLLTWPQSASSPRLYGMVHVVKAEDGYTAIWKSLPTPPSIEPNELVRIGYQDESGSWRGSVASGALFQQKVDRNILIHVDSQGDIYHIGVTGEEIPNPAKTKIKVKKGDKKAAEAAKKLKKSEWRDGETYLEVVVDSAPPMPVLNQPVVLNEDGKIDAPEGQEKSFLQKYWWAIALFLVVNLMAAGGGEESK